MKFYIQSQNIFSRKTRFIFDVSNLFLKYKLLSLFLSSCGTNFLPRTLSHSLILRRIFLEESLHLSMLLGFDWCSSPRGWGAGGGRAAGQVVGSWPPLTSPTSESLAVRFVSKHPAGVYTSAPWLDACDTPTCVLCRNRITWTFFVLIGRPAEGYYLQELSLANWCLL